MKNENIEEHAKKLLQEIYKEEVTSGRMPAIKKYIITIECKEYEWPRYIADSLSCSNALDFLKIKRFTVQDCQIKDHVYGDTYLQECEKGY